MDTMLFIENLYNDVVCQCTPLKKSIDGLTDKDAVYYLISYIYKDKREADFIFNLIYPHFPTIRELLTAPEHKLHKVGLLREQKLLDFFSLIREYIIRAYTLPERTIYSEEMQRDFATMVHSRIGYLSHEVILGILLTKKNEFIGIESMALGSHTVAVFDAKTIIHIMKKAKAYQLVLVHNHPSGNALPSQEDIETTEVIQQACAACDYVLLDHYIVTRDAVYSIYTQSYIIE